MRRRTLYRLGPLQGRCAEGDLLMTARLRFIMGPRSLVLDLARGDRVIEVMCISGASVNQRSDSLLGAHFRRSDVGSIKEQHPALIGCIRIL
jgi:hypothetical protein